MNSFQKNIRFYIIIGVVALALLLVLLCMSEKITLVELTNDLLIGIFSSLVLLIFLEVRAGMIQLILTSFTYSIKIIYPVVYL